MAERRAAGWYDDEADAAALRYWDGRGWTPHTVPNLVATTPAEPPAATPVFAVFADEADDDVQITRTIRFAPEHTTVPTPTDRPAASVSVYGLSPARPGEELTAGQVALLVLAALAAGTVTLAIASAIAMMLLG